MSKSFLLTFFGLIYSFNFKEYEKNEFEEKTLKEKVQENWIYYTHNAVYKN